MSFHVIIPARYQSSRLPGKPLSKIGELTMIERVCIQASKSGAKSITVATDHLDIKACVENAGFDVVMTREDHVSGSDRIYEAAQKIGLDKHDVVVNVQGDEPFIPSENISLVAALLSSDHAKMATLCCSMDSKEAQDPNAVKVIFDKQGKAIYFSRAQIPFVREPHEQSVSYFRHIGIYAYRVSLLEQFVNWPESQLESLEKLEQLRVLENGEAIMIKALTKAPPAGIDTPDDLARANQSLKENRR